MRPGDHRARRGTVRPAAGRPRAAAAVDGGDRSPPHHLEVRDRLAARLPRLRSHVFPGTHHQAGAGVLQPEQDAAQLRALWSA